MEDEQTQQTSKARIWLLVLLAFRRFGAMIWAWFGRNVGFDLQQLGLMLELFVVLLALIVLVNLKLGIMFWQNTLK